MSKKKYYDTFRRICDRDNIEAAIYAAAKGKRHKRSVRHALAHVEETVERIRDILLSHKRFLPEVRQGHEINDGIRAKRRIIVHPDFTEQIIDHALLQVIGPHFMRRFYRWSCGSIPGRGQEEMSAYILRKAKAHPERCKYVAVMDVKKCFDTIDTEAVYRGIAKFERDPETLALVRYKLFANAVRLRDGTVRRGGVPIGVYTSPWFANFALDGFDHVMKDECGIYLLVRYADDIFAAHGNRREFMRAIKRGSVAIAKNGLHWKKTPCARLWRDGDIGKVRFCGAHFRRDRMEVHDSVFIRARRTVNRIARKRASGGRVTWHDASRLVSYGGRFRSFGSFNAFGRSVLQGKIRFSDMRRKISAHDKLKNKQLKEVA